MANPQLNTLWLGNDKGEDRQRTEDNVRNNIFLLSRLKEILDKQVAQIERMEASLAVYDNSSWAFKQAHLNGMRHAYQELYKLTDHLTKE